MAGSEPIRTPELSELETFVLAVDEGSIAKAATKLRISTQAAAKRIRQLEVLAHSPLLVRGHRGVSATETGAQLYPIARELLSHRGRALGALAGAPPSDPLRIAGMHRLLGRLPALAAEELLRETESVLAAIFHGTAEAMLLTRPQDGLIHEVNDAGVRFIGYDQPELRGRTVREISLWEDSERRDRVVERALSTGEPQAATLVLRTRGGERVRVRAGFAPIDVRGTTHMLVSIRGLGPAESAVATASPHGALSLGPELEARFLGALRRGDAATAESLVEVALQRGAALADVHTQLIERAMHTIGELWERDEITVAQEHHATSISQALAAAMLARIGRAGARSRARVMMCAVEGEQHVLGLRLAADVLEAAGYDVIYLGADVPAQALLDACHLHRPDVLGLTVTMWLNVPTLLEQARAVGALRPAPRLMMGGRAAALAARHGATVPIVSHSDRVLGTVQRLLTGAPVRHAERPELTADLSE